jgi:hypothetical protein
MTLQLAATAVHDLLQQQLHCSCCCNGFLMVRALHCKVAELSCCMLLLLRAAVIAELL